jgi:hypothetical protein
MLTETEIALREHRMFTCDQCFGPVAKIHCLDCGETYSQTPVEVMHEENEQLRADLLATRRALKMAQSSALMTHADAFGVIHSRQSARLRDKGHVGFYIAGPSKGLTCLQRATRLLDHYAAKFEREAAEL